MSKICLRMDSERITNINRVKDWTGGKFVFVPDVNNAWRLDKRYVGILKSTYKTDNGTSVFEVVLINGDLYNTDKVRKAIEMELDEYSNRTDVIIDVSKNTLLNMHGGDYEVY